MRGRILPNKSIFMEKRTLYLVCLVCASIYGNLKKNYAKAHFACFVFWAQHQFTLQPSATSLRDKNNKEKSKNAFLLFKEFLSVGKWCYHFHSKPHHYFLGNIKAIVRTTLSALSCENKGSNGRMGERGEGVWRNGEKGVILFFGDGVWFFLCVSFLFQVSGFHIREKHDDDADDNRIVGTWSK